MAKLSKSEMNRLLAEVTEDVAALLKSEAQETAALNKADPGMQAPGETTPEGSSSAPQPEESSSSSSSSSSPSGEGSFSHSADPAATAMDGGTPAAGPGPEGTVAPDAAPAAQPGADPAGDAGVSPEALEGEYMKLPPEELKMHLMAASSAYDKLTGGGAGQAPPAAPGPEGSMSPSAPPPEMGKGEYSEASHSESSSSSMGKGEFDDKSGQKKAGSLGKSEEIKAIETRLAKAEEAHLQVENLTKALADKDAQIGALEANINRIAAGVQKIVTRQTSMRKSVSGISELGFIAKPGTPQPGQVDASSLTKSEITARLNQATARKDLTKSDRDAINRYVVGSEPVESIAKFLTT